MQSSIKKKPFSLVYRQSLRVAGLTVAARQLMMRRSTLQKDLKENRYSEAPFPKMCALVGLRGRDNEPLTCAEAEAMYEIDRPWRNNYHGEGDSAGVASGTLEGWFDKLDVARLDGPAARRRAAMDTQGLFERMGKAYHALVIFAASAQPLVFRCFSEATNAPVHAVAAVRCGMHLCVIAPARKVIEERYATSYGFDELLDYDSFLRNYHDFGECAVKAWEANGMSRPEARRLFEQQVVMVESEDCPFHVPGWTFSLVGRFSPAGDYYHRATYRTPGHATSTWYAHPNVELFERRLAKAALAALRLAQDKSQWCQEDVCTSDTRRQCAIKRLIAMLERNTGEIEREGPRCRVD